jgi:hypothetical protein
MPNYKNIGIYNFFITNKKYIIQHNSQTDYHHPEGFKSYCIDDSKLKIELNIYVGENYFVKYVLLLIYLLGITPKNYTMLEYNDFQEYDFFTVCH